jgi:hypothetical protein
LFNVEAAILARKVCNKYSHVTQYGVYRVAAQRLRPFMAAVLECAWKVDLPPIDFIGV